MGRSSGEGRSSTDSFGRRLFGLFFLVLLANTFVNLFVTKPNLFDLLRIKESERRLIEKIERERRRKEELLALEKMLRQNPREVKEMLIREYLLRLKKGERIVPLPEELRD